MRIIAGRHRGRRLRTVPGPKIRCTADRVKESMFNIIAAEVPGAHVLDLFCGSGSLGLEAISRGADHAVFVDTWRRALECTSANITLIDADSQSRTLHADAHLALDRLSKRGSEFTLIFADPPYGEGWAARLLVAISKATCRASGGVFVLEHHKKDLPGDTPVGFSLLTSRRFGDTVVSIWRWSDQISTPPQKLSDES